MLACLPTAVGVARKCESRKKLVLELLLEGGVHARGDRADLRQVIVEVVELPARSPWGAPDGLVAGMLLLDHCLPDATSSRSHLSTCELGVHLQEHPVAPATGLGSADLEDVAQVAPIGAGEVRAVGREDGARNVDVAGPGACKAPLSDEGVLRYAGTAYDERHPGGLFVGLLLLRQPVLSKHIPIIRCEPDVGVCQLSRIRESRKRFVHGVIHVTNLFQLALIPVPKLAMLQAAGVRDVRLSPEFLGLVRHVGFVVTAPVGELHPIEIVCMLGGGGVGVVWALGRHKREPRSKDLLGGRHPVYKFAPYERSVGSGPGWTPLFTVAVDETLTGPRVSVFREDDDKPVPTRRGHCAGGVERAVGVLHVARISVQALPKDSGVDAHSLRARRYRVAL